ncbi:MAG: DUF4402 domain-containing protein [Sphingomicrobium sp.]
MTSICKKIVLAAALVVCGLSTTPASAASVNASVNAKVIKPLQLTAKQGLDFGQILLGAGTGSWTVSLSQTGTLTCPAPLVCTGAPRTAILNVAGSNGNVVLISAATTDLTNATGSKIRFTPSAPTSVTLTNSGNPGTDFNVGGALALTATTADGTYSGVVTITADYQ